ncbi:hypothetical protein [Streptomyces sp. NPDC057623]
MEPGNDNLGSCGPQPVCHHGEVLGTVVQAVDEHYGGQFARLLRSV